MGSWGGGRVCVCVCVCGFFSYPHLSCILLLIRYGELLPRMKALLYSEGGPIVSAQVRSVVCTSRARESEERGKRERDCDG